MPTRPNILFILCDDLGYGDLGCYGNPLIETPRIDQLARGGARCRAFYAAAPYCLPSRRGFMSGTHPYRGGLEIPMPALEGVTTLPAMLQEQGYATALIGKWHLGMSGESHPLDAGFDHFYGTEGSNDWNGPGFNYQDFKYARMEEWQTPLYRGRRQDGTIPQDAFTERYTRETIRFIDEHDDEPFFVFLSHNMPHAPLFPSERFRCRSAGGVFGDVVEELDDSVGRIVDHLRSRGLLDDTLIVFTSDNGPWSMYGEFGGTAHPLRGEKSTCWEGGDRVPAIFHWPGRIAPGVCESFISGLDLYATLAGVLGVDLAEDQAVDSLDVGPVLFDGQPSPRRDYLFVHDAARSFIAWPYKIHTATVERTRDPFEARIPARITVHDRPLLYKLDDDISEVHDLAAAEPELLEQMQVRLAEAEAEILGSDDGS